MALPRDFRTPHIRAAHQPRRHRHRQSRHRKDRSHPATRREQVRLSFRGFAPFRVLSLQITERMSLPSQMQVLFCCSCFGRGSGNCNGDLAARLLPADVDSIYGHSQLSLGLQHQAKFHASQQQVSADDGDGRTRCSCSTLMTHCRWTACACWPRRSWPITSARPTTRRRASCPSSCTPWPRSCRRRRSSRPTTSSSTPTQNCRASSRSPAAFPTPRRPLSREFWSL